MHTEEGARTQAGRQEHLLSREIFWKHADRFCAEFRVSAVLAILRRVLALLCEDAGTSSRCLDHQRQSIFERVCFRSSVQRLDAAWKR